MTTLLSTTSTQPEIQEFSVDLKWSLWSQYEEHWRDYSREGEVWDAMRASFLGCGPNVKIWTAPRKEIRYGLVNVSHRCADGYFRTEWDEPHALADTLGLLDGMSDDEWQAWLDSDDFQAFCESLPYNEHSCNGEPGLLVDFEHYADTFEELMRLVDESEEQVLQESNECWNELCEMYKKPELKNK